MGSLRTLVIIHVKLQGNFSMLTFQAELILSSASIIFSGCCSPRYRQNRTEWLLGHDSRNCLISLEPLFPPFLIHSTENILHVSNIDTSSIFWRSVHRVIDILCPLAALDWIRPCHSTGQNCMWLVPNQRMTDSFPLVLSIWMSLVGLEKNQKVSAQTWDRTRVFKMRG